MNHGAGAAARPRRAARLVDIGSLVLIVGGAALYMYALHGMRRLADGRMRRSALVGPDGGWNLTDWGNYDRLARVGLGLAAAGIVLSILSLAWVTLRRQPALADEQADHS